MTRVSTIDESRLGPVRGPVIDNNNISEFKFEGLFNGFFSLPSRLNVTINAVYFIVQKP